MRGASISLAILLYACGATSSPSGSPPGTPSGGGAPDSPSPAEQTSSYPAMRYLRHGEPLAALGTDGRITLEGGEHVATFRDDSQIVDHEGNPLLAVTSEGHVVFSSEDEAPMRLLDGQLAVEPGRLISIDEAGHFRYGEHPLEFFVEGYQPEFARTAFLGWLALRVAPIPTRRRMAGEPREVLELMYTQAAGNGAVPSAAARTPAAIPCGGAVAWPDTAPPAFEALGIGFADPIRYAYSIEVDGDAFVLRAEGDLDCDGVTSRFELHGRRTADGMTREPDLRVVDELE